MKNQSKIAGLMVAVSLVVASCGGYGSEASATDGTAAADSAAASPQASDEQTAGESSAVISTASGELGDMLVGDKGLTVYGFTDDTEGLPTCEGACSDAWPAVTVDGDELPAGLDPAIFSLVDGVNGEKQLKAGKWPLYFFAGDAAAGDVNGQESGGVWFAVAPDGSLINGPGGESAPSPEPSQAPVPAPESNSGY